MELSVLSEWPMSVEVGTLEEREIRRGGRRRDPNKARPGARRRGRPRKNAAPWDSYAMMRALEALAKLVTPQIVLPVQLKSEPEDLPEYGLLRAVLLSAITEYMDSFKPSPNLEVAQRRREARKVAESWFAGDPGAPIEFELCCAMFGMSADRMREKIRQLTRRLTSPLS
jgi:hypothetical protein